MRVDLLLNPEIWIAFLTLLALEIVLGIDNVVFISILVDKLPEEAGVETCPSRTVSLQSPDY
jgi:predicted tellurium resistance membrane protein TerC